MARVKLTEYRAKKILLGNSYTGISLTSSTPLPKKGNYVLKVDEGVKKRFKRGLVVLNQPVAALPKYISLWKKKGFSQFLLESYLPHAQNEERYLSIERVRNGLRVLYATEGGIDIEEHPEKVQAHSLKSEHDVEFLSKTLELPHLFLSSLVRSFDAHHFTFLEINPLVVQGGVVSVLDAAALVDDSAEFFVSDSWKKEDVVEVKTTHDAEEKIRTLSKTSPSSFKLQVLNPNGSLFFLLSGGGGSIVIADEAALKGHGKEIANYGEYSGGPTREETYLYTKEVLRLVLDSKAPKKALVIAGGVANFTDVQKTFAGIIDALQEILPHLQKKNVRVFVRRGGPSEEAGLVQMKTFLEHAGLLGSVYGSEAPLTHAIVDAVQYVSSKKKNKL